VKGGDAPFILQDQAKILLHLIPINAFSFPQQYPVSELEHKSTNLRPLGANVWTSRHNFDGFATFAQLAESAACFSYVQVFRSGMLEVVNSDLLTPGERGSYIYSTLLEGEVLRALRRYMTVLQDMSVPAPIIVALSLLGVRNYSVAANNRFDIPGRARSIDRDDLRIPEIIIQEYDVDAARAMQPAFDAIWNAAGWPRSMNYDPAGNWSEG
jgi:hypothetical protein